MTETTIKNADELRRFFTVESKREYPKFITVKRGRRRSNEQNRYLWGVVYNEFLDQSGLREQGWQNDDLHEYLLGEWSGWQTLEGLGRKRMKPVNRSSNLNKAEFSDYVSFIQQKAAELGIFIPDPEA